MEYNFLYSKYGFSNIYLCLYLSFGKLIINVLINYSFFTGFPEYQKVFRGFASIPLDQLATNKRLMAHGFTVFSSIAGLVDNLEDPEVLDELLLNTGRSHIKRGLKPGDFQVIFFYFAVVVLRKITKLCQEEI